MTVSIKPEGCAHCASAPTLRSEAERRKWWVECHRCGQRAAFAAFQLSEGMNAEYWTTTKWFRDMENQTAEAAVESWNNQQAGLKAVGDTDGK